MCPCCIDKVLKMTTRPLPLKWSNKCWNRWRRMRGTENNDEISCNGHVIWLKCWWYMSLSTYQYVRSCVNIWWQTCYWSHEVYSDGTLCSFFIDKDEVISDAYYSISKTEFCETDILVWSPVSLLCMKWTFCLRWYRGVLHYSGIITSIHVIVTIHCNCKYRQ